MARNGSGSYAKVNTFVAGNTITAAGHNQNWDDLVTEMTNSVAADGQTTITGQLKGAAGTKTAPGFSFSSDLDTGIYRIGANNLGVSCGDTKIIDVTTSGAAITGGLSSSSTLTVTAGGLVVSSGGMAIAGTSVVTGSLAVSSNFSVNTSKFTVNATTGDTAVAGDFAVATNKFTVAASSGNTVVAGTLNVTGATTLSGGVTGLIAAQSDQETATSTTLAVSPGRQQFHPGHPKFWAYVTVSGGTPTLATNYNVTSITDSGVGSLTVTIATDFSGTSWAPLCNADKTGTIADDTFYVTPAAAGSIVLSNLNTNVAALDPVSWTASGFGDQA